MPQLPLSIPGANTMPMSAGTSQLPIDSTSLIAGTPQRAPAMTPPPRAAAGMMTGPAGAPAGAFPPPGSPSQPPWQVTMQPDGSSIYKVDTAGGPIVIGVNPAPKLPKALQNPTPSSQATPQ